MKLHGSLSSNRRHSRLPCSKTSTFQSFVMAPFACYIYTIIPFLLSLAMAVIIFLDKGSLFQPGAPLGPIIISGVPMPSPTASLAAGTMAYEPASSSL